MNLGHLQFAHALLFFPYMLLLSVSEASQPVAISSYPIHISSRRPPRHVGTAESSPLPEPSGSVFLGILRKTLGVDPGMTPCPVPSP